MGFQSLLFYLSKSFGFEALEIYDIVGTSIVYGNINELGVSIKQMVAHAITILSEMDLNMDGSLVSNIHPLQRV